MNKMLQKKWILWEKKIQNNERVDFNYMIGQQQLLQMRDVQELCYFTSLDYWEICEYFQNEHRKDENLDQSQFSLFKDGINPIWEDQKNIYGSSFCFYLNIQNRQDVQEVWENIVCEFLSENFLYSRHVNGIRVLDKIHSSNRVKFEVWLDLGSTRFKQTDNILLYEKNVLLAISEKIQWILGNFIQDSFKPKVWFREHLERVYQLILIEKNFMEIIPLYIYFIRKFSNKKWVYTSHLERVILAQGPCQSSLYRSLFNKVGIPTIILLCLIQLHKFYCFYGFVFWEKNFQFLTQSNKNITNIIKLINSIIKNLYSQRYSTKWASWSF